MSQHILTCNVCSIKGKSEVFRLGGYPTAIIFACGHIEENSTICRRILIEESQQEVQSYIRIAQKEENRLTGEVDF